MHVGDNRERDAGITLDAMHFRDMDAAINCSFRRVETIRWPFALRWVSIRENSNTMNAKLNISTSILRVVQFLSSFLTFTLWK